MLVKTFVVSKFFFFDASEHVIRALISGMYCPHNGGDIRADKPLGCLILTELSVFKSFIFKNWPLFSPRASFVMLGVAMIFLGNSVLGNLNKQATSQNSIGLPFWRLVIGAGIVVFTMGFINLFAVSGTRVTKIDGANRYRRASSSEMPRTTLQLDKFDRMVPWLLTKQTLKRLLQSYRAAKATIDHSSWAANATPYRHTLLAKTATCRKPPRCTWLFRALSPKRHRALEARVRSTAKVPRVNDMRRQAPSSADPTLHIIPLLHRGRPFREGREHWKLELRRRNVKRLIMRRGWRSSLKSDHFPR